MTNVNHDPTFGGEAFHNPSKKCWNCGDKCPNDKFCSRECLSEYVRGHGLK